MMLTASLVIVGLALGVPLVCFVALIVQDYRSPSPKPMTWAQQQRADRVLWSGMQREAMDDWEARCQCPDPKEAFLRDMREERDRIFRDPFHPASPLLPSDMYRPMGPRAPRRDNFNQYMRYEAEA